MRKSTKFVVVAAAVTAIGLLGLGVGYLLFPDSNLLGGLGLVFGPIYWLGLVLLAAAVVAWLFDALRRRGGRGRGAAG